MINNIQNNTFSGSVEDITQEYFGLELTEPQMFFAIGSLFITVIFFFTFIYLLIKTYITKSCVGCKRLAKCEKRIKEIENQISLNGYFDNQTFNNLSAKIDKLSEEINNGNK